ncbi:hypothetical protein K227x_28420 [Rubripirellula lacrimiformis]|uniref:N-acetyltransferase domain-containing protein n=1 Tax=Rubripirellula lacrimiformis TaxID=1930273 RepID=A0A517NBD9_9BACT|nr:hypothetical protein [Rubripirellula lacrimiformis]QDT04451.1 hypothetical protein K227x_28420 [Rubripirellula lacrimiformis]
MIKIRSFRNSDLPAMVDVWLEHWASVGPVPRVNLARLEQAIVSRTFFDPHWLLVAEAETQPECQGKQSLLGWCHVIPGTAAEDIDHENGEVRPALAGAGGDPALAQDSSFATLAALCARPAQAAEVAPALVAAAMDHVRSAGCRSLLAGLIRDDVGGYAGLEPFGHGIGVLNHDQVSVTTLKQMGFEPIHALTRLVASLQCYRPPVSREALQFRRTASTQSQSIIPTTRRLAAGLSHLDIEEFRLVDRSGQVLAEMAFWFSDPEAEVLCPSTAILDLRQSQARGELSSAESYLIAATMQSLVERNVMSVETAIDSEKKTLVQQLQRICFDATDEGQVWGLVL